ncbi:MAG: hypothetical protein IJI14_04675 [Anaerolineaceae bacterium]|nr:hypothetical protein [Anaerolineaceae bacterium]
MDYAMVSKLEKARYYATERDRFQFDNFQVTVKGNNHGHVVTYDHGKWSCDCEFCKSHGRCSHTMALEIILHGMVEIAYDD